MSPALEPMLPNWSRPSELFETKMQVWHFLTMSGAASGAALSNLDTREPSTQALSTLPAASCAPTASISIAFVSKKSALAEPTISWSHSADKILLALVTATASTTYSCRPCKALLFQLLSMPADSHFSGDGS